MITAKVVVSHKSDSGEGGDRQTQVNFHADYQDDRNKEWSRYTPSLNLSMTLKGDVADLFEVGQAYTLQFVESD